MNAALALLLALFAALGITPPPPMVPPSEQAPVAPLPPPPEKKISVVGSVVPADISNGF